MEFLFKGILRFILSVIDIIIIKDIALTILTRPPPPMSILDKPWLEGGLEQVAHGLGGGIHESERRPPQSKLDKHP